MNEKQQGLLEGLTPNTEACASSIWSIWPRRSWP